MNLLIISNMAHYQRDGKIVGHGPTAREIDHLSSLFDRVRHVGYLHTGEAPANALPYTSERVEFIAVLPSGGARLRDKLQTLWLLPVYLRTIARELQRSDAVHVRCPANISLLAVILLAALRRPEVRWVKYAGNWQTTGRGAWSYRLQRWWLNRGLHRGLVTINGYWPGQPKHVRSFPNPCLTEQELQEAYAAAAGKRLEEPVHLLYVGQLLDSKGVDTVLRAVACLRGGDLPLTCDVIGDGARRRELEDLTASLGIGREVHFRGWMPRPALVPYYARAHFILLPSRSEGWPKVLSEAMAYGVVPVASHVGSIPQYLERFGIGKTANPADAEGFAGAIKWYTAHPSAWQEEARKGHEAAWEFSYEAYIRAVRDMLDGEGWQTRLVRRA